jgi:hypothetical protein
MFKEESETAWESNCDKRQTVTHGPSRSETFKGDVWLAKSD